MADNWQASIHENGAPASLVGVDKKHRTFNFFEKNSPLRLRYSYPCVTGQLNGDKQQINDLRTPEGVYFVEYKIANGLDFREYGGIAYTLNYPNPVDKLRGKTGHGIWIHSKGFELSPTRGCVAIDLRNIAEIGPRLTPGLPVVVAEELKGIAGFDDGVPAQLVSLMTGWTNAWSSRSPEMFNYYDPESYSRATENFTAFRQNKERLFKTLSFIKIYNREIHALEGPGYWVTWAEQLYTASNLSTEGVRRLYWQKDAAGRYRIVGMEWIPRDLGMRADFQKGRLVAQVTQPVMTDAGSEAPVPPKLDMPEQPEDPPLPAPSPALDNNKNAGISSVIAKLKEKLVAVSEPLVPSPQRRLDPPPEIEWGTGKKLTEPKENIPAIEQKPLTDTGQKGETPPEGSSVGDTAPDTGKIDAAITAWVDAIKQKNQLVSDSYDQKKYNRIINGPRGQSYGSVMQTLQREFRQPWLAVLTREPDIKIDNGIAKSSLDMLILGPQGSRQGIQDLWWSKDDTGTYKIVASQFKPMALGLEANYLEGVSEEITAMLESWRQSWEGARINDYMEFYDANAWQQGRQGAVNIRRQKENLWNRVRPALVQLSGMRFSIDPAGIRVDMNQSYADSAGKTDKGVKTLLLRFDGEQWRIKREDWANLPVMPKVID